MSSTFLGLNTAYTGLQAANAALNTTANNIANVETKGYSRQQVSTQAADAIRSFTTYGCVGAGVETLAIERIRDNFYDQKYWLNQSKLGEYEVKKYYMSCIEDYYKDDKTIKGFTTIFNEYSDSLEELAKNPDDTKYRQQMIGQAGNLTTYFSDTYTNMRKLQDDVNQEIKVNVDRINSIAQELASLNKQINVIEMNSGLVANELRDQRDLLVDELSELVTVETEEQAVIDYTNVDRDTGGTRYMVKICGHQLVDGNSYQTLTCVTRELNVKTNQTDIDGLYDIYFTGYESDWTADDYRKKGDALEIFGGDASGKLAGLMQMRDGNNGEGFAGRVTGVTTGADGNRCVSLTVSADYLKDLNKLNLSMDGGIIQISSRNLYFTEWEYEYKEGDSTATFTFTLDDEKNKGRDGSLLVAEICSDPDQTVTNASVGESIAYQGIPYYLSQMNEWVRLYSSAANDILQSGTLADGTAGHNLYTGTHTVDGTELNLVKTDRVFGSGGEWYDISDPTGMTTKMDKDGKLTRSIGVGTKLTDEDGIEYTVNAVSGTSLTVDFTAKDGTPGTKTITLDNTKGLTAQSDAYYMLTAGNFRVAEELITDADLLATRYEATNVSDGVEKNDIVKKLIQLKTDDTMMSFRGCSADQYLVTVLGDVALNSQRAGKFEENYTYMQKTIGNQRLSISGVDNDEEAVNLTKFQQQYNMASKMIQTLTEVYDRLILQTGV
ncbi:MAG: flagellar hook-associated protein FlgK [Lachnospiraceae bacterium]|nr:flagellar hook-associated protein FlgK [Lachnospiraceae bacterium]